MEMLKAHGLSDVEIDEEGNAMGVRKGTGGGPLVVVSAHLDTVFPEGTDVKVKRDGTRLAAPGVGDDSAGLATLLSIVRAMDAAGIKTKSDIVFLGDVGEEGLGDLRGVRYFFTKGKYKDQVKYFFSLDGGGTPTITNCGVGSKRYRVTYKGPGGHSFQAFGLVNPMAAMAQTVVEFYKIQTPTKPKTTYAASVTGGGTSVNSIPNEVWMEFDMRSVDAKELDRLEKRFLAIVNQSLETENFARSTKEGSISADIKLIGDRPAGQTDAKQDIVQTHDGRLPGEWNQARLRMRLDRLQHADEPRHSGGHDPACRQGGPLPRARRVDRHRSAEQSYGEEDRSHHRACRCRRPVMIAGPGACARSGPLRRQTPEDRRRVPSLINPDPFRVIDHWIAARPRRRSTA